MAFQAHSDSLFERRVSLMLITMLPGAGVNRTLLQRLLRGWALALALRRKAPRSTEQHARWTCSRCPTCLEVELDHDVFMRVLQGEVHQPPGVGEQGQPPQAGSP